LRFVVGVFNPRAGHGLCGRKVSGLYGEIRHPVFVGLGHEPDVGLPENLGNLLLCELVGIHLSFGREGAVVCMDGAGVGTTGLFSKYFFDGAPVYRHNLSCIDSLYILLCHGSLLKNQRIAVRL